MGRRGRPPGTPDQGPLGSEEPQDDSAATGGSIATGGSTGVGGPTEVGERRADSPAAATDATTWPQGGRRSSESASARAAGSTASGSSTPASAATSASATATRTRPAPTQTQRRRKPIGGIVIIVVVLAIIGGLIAAGAAILGPIVADQLSEPADYEGAGSGEVVVRIESGWNGSDVAVMLEDQGVIADQEPFYDLLVADSTIQFQPGSYRLAEQMSSQAALDALLDPASKVQLQVTVPEGFLLQQVYARLAESTGIPEADFVQAGSNYAQFGLPAEAVSLEGWLFPATYTFDDGVDATQILQTMVDRMRQALTDRQVAEADWERVVIFASLIQREAGPVENFGRVARVFQNRLDIGMLLQSDATVAYGTGNTDLITTTDDERGDPNNPYNTYLYPGLPVGPIGAPGDAAIAAALSPEAGDWLFFVTTNPDTGETVFSETLEEHNQAVLIFQAWLRDNPEYGG